MVAANRPEGRPPDNYEKKLFRLVEEGKIPVGDVSLIDVLHDDWCLKITRGGGCNCNPDIRLNGKVVD